MAVNKVARGDGSVLIDLSTDTVTSAYDIIAGKVGHLANGAIVTGLGSDTLDFTDISASGDGNVTIEGTSGGSVTITDEANTTGTTCVITTNAEPTPSEDIPLNTQLIDYTKCTSDTGLDFSGSETEQQWYYLSDYTPVASGMTFEYTAGYWTYLGLYGSAKNALNTIIVYEDGTQDPDDSNIAHGTLSGNELPATVAYVRLVSTGTNSTRMSLIRTA